MGLPFTIWRTGLLSFARDISGVHNLEGPDGAAHIHRGARLDRIARQNIRDYDLRLAGFWPDFATEGNHASDVKLVTDIFLDIQGHIIRVPKLQDNRLAPTDATGKGHGEVS